MKKRAAHFYQRGFTLIELLVVIAIIAILAVVVFVALDPARRFADARDSRRFVDVNNILTGVHQLIVDQGGALPVGEIDSVETPLTANFASTELGTCTTCLDLSATLSAYLKSMPTDPLNGDSANTGYFLDVDANNIVTISAPDAENDTVQVSR